jgi:hypothetical protein
MAEMSEIFWSSFITIGSGMVLALFALCYRSKCIEIQIGCIKIKRDVQLEEKELEFTTTHQPSNPINNDVV